MPISRTQESPSAFGRKGERVANTPMRALPPRRGGRTVGDQLSRTASENCHITQMWEKPSSPRSGLLAPVFRLEDYRGFERIDYPRLTRDAEFFGKVAAHMADSFQLIGLAHRFESALSAHIDMPFTSM